MTLKCADEAKVCLERAWYACCYKEKKCKTPFLHTASAINQMYQSSVSNETTTRVAAAAAPL